jgi:hypothetical protein
LILNDSFVVFNTLVCISTNKFCLLVKTQTRAEIYKFCRLGTKNKKQMKLKLITLLVLIFSCKSTQGVNITYQTNSIKAKVEIPDNFKKEIIEKGQDVEYRFSYSDLSMIYITDESSTPELNYNNIDNDTTAIQKNFLASMENDTLTLEGKDKSGRFWKNKKLKNISIGYLNVPEVRKSEFDKAISSIKIK